MPVVVAAAAPYRSALRSPRIRRGVRARVRAILPRRPGTEGPGKGGGRLRRGRGGIPPRDNHGRHVRQAPAGRGGVAADGGSSDPGPAERGGPRVALGTLGTAAAGTPWSPAAGPRCAFLLCPLPGMRNLEPWCRVAELPW